MPPLQRTTTAGGTTTCVCDSNAIVPVLDLVSGILSEIYILSDSCCRCPNFNSTSNPVYFYSCIHFLYHVLFSRPQFVFLASFHFLVVAAFISNLFWFGCGAFFLVWQWYFYHYACHCTLHNGFHLCKCFGWDLFCSCCRCPNFNSLLTRIFLFLCLQPGQRFVCHIGWMPGWSSTTLVFAIHHICVLHGTGFWLHCIAFYQLWLWPTPNIAKKWQQHENDDVKDN